MVELIYNILNTAWQVVLNWWWVPVPFIIFGSEKKMGSFKFMWLWWRREVWIFAQKFVLLEIKMPMEVLKPLRSMEQVFSSIWGNVYDPPDKFWEKWFEGKMLLSVQLEMIGLNGEPHLYVRCHESRRNAIEASIYSQYPEAEISLADDYTKYVPQDVPNRNWDIWGCDYELIKPDVYPLKTYPKFFEEREALKEEKRVDPMATLLEGFGTLGPGEQLWIQIAASPVSIVENNFVDRGRKEADRLAKRPEEAKQKPILQEAFDEVAYGKVPGEEKNEELKIEALLPVEARMTPGERDIVAGVEDKISKRCFDSYIRFIYLAKRDVYFGGGKAVPLGFFQQFATENLNQPKPWTRTITKVKRYPVLDLWRARRLFIRKRRLFFRYVKRMSPLFPRPGGNFILNTEELATIFHFPGHTVAPAPFVSRVEAKRGEAPPGLPVE